MRFRQKTWRGLLVGSALLVCALACAPAARAQSHEALAQLDEEGRWVNGVTESWWMGDGIAAANAGVAAARWKEIGDGLAGAGAEVWPGDYFRGGDTHGTYLRWSPRSGFVIAHVNKCAAQVMGLVYGRVEATPTLVQFFPEVDQRAARGHGHHAGPTQTRAPRDVIRYVPVRWRGEHLLVAEDEMADFGDYVAGLGEYNGYRGLMFLDGAAFFSRTGRDEAGDGAPPVAPPVVPPGYERFIKRPIEARVTTVGRSELKSNYNVWGDDDPWRSVERAAVTPVTINAGTARGVKRGMVFRVTRPAEGDTVVVLRAGRRASTGVVVRDVDERGAETFYDHAESRERPHSRVARGWRLTTSHFD